MPNLELPQLPQLPQLQLPVTDVPWSPDVPESTAYVAADQTWRRSWKVNGTVGPPPPLPADAEDLSTWRWSVPRVPSPGQSAEHAEHAVEAPVEAPVEVEKGGRRVRFYRRVSCGSSAARITRPINNGRFYWELHLGDRMFGTSVMVGVGTASVRTSTATFKNLIGEDEHGWGFSHKGVVWHGGLWSPYSEPFPQNEATTIGVLFDGLAGTLGFFKDNRWLGVAFTGMDKVSQPLYPMVASTARNTKMTLLSARRELGTLVERCRASVLRSMHAPGSPVSPRGVRRLPLPASMRAYIQDGIVTPVSLPATNPAHRLLI